MKTECLTEYLIHAQKPDGTAVDTTILSEAKDGAELMHEISVFRGSERLLFVSFIDTDGDFFYIDGEGLLVTIAALEVQDGSED